MAVQTVTFPLLTGVVSLCLALRKLRVKFDGLCSFIAWIRDA